MRFRPSVVCLLLIGIGAPLVSAGTAAAQGAGDGFLFREPVASLVLRGGFGHANAGSDLFSFTTEQLTLGRGDFSGPMVGADFAVRVHPRLDVGVGAAFIGSHARSEFRDWIGDDDLPIEQTTTFQRVPITANVKAYLTPRGRSVGNFAWIPARYAPYVGAGAGAMWYRFRQQGEFVDFETDEIFEDEMESSGWAPAAHAMAGLDFSLTPRLGLSAEARYSWARAQPGGAFALFDPIDLSGLSASIGLQLRF